MGKLRPILFNTPMVQAILEGRKTQTRRIFGPVPDGIDLQVWLSEHRDYIMSLSKYGAENDVLWVRETWAPLGDYPRCNYCFIYKADTFNSYSKWKPSIHMPFEACRLFLRVKSVRVERLQDITEDNAKAEGVEGRYSEVFHEMRYRDYAFSEFRADWKDPRVSFITLWESINGRESWRKNPWVWVIEFERISKEEALS